jgi:hypothetical protein
MTKSKVTKDTLCKCGHPKHMHNALGCQHNVFLKYCACEKFTLPEAGK